VRALAAGGDAEEEDEEHDAEAVVEQRLARHLPGERALGAGGLEYAEDRDRIGRRDERAEEQAPRKGQRMAERAEDRPERAARKERRDEDAQAREKADRPLAPRELAEIDLQRAGEKPEREQAVQQRAGQGQA